MIAPRPASTVLVIRDGHAGVEVLLGLRPARQAFGGAWVFPGGVVEPSDHDVELTGIEGPDGAWRAAALRELAEEVGIYLSDPEVHSDRPLEGAAVHRHVADLSAAWSPDRLAYLSNWVTPLGLPKRFDTRFFLAAVEPDREVGPVSDELVRVDWMAPEAALGLHHAGDIELIMPTKVHLEMLVPFPTAAEVMAFAVSQPEVRAVQPRLVDRDGRVEVVIP